MDMHWGKLEETETQPEPYMWQIDSYILLMARKAVYFEEIFSEAWFRNRLLQLAIVKDRQTFGGYIRRYHEGFTQMA